jgi:hypothetical protein
MSVSSTPLLPTGKSRSSSEVKSASPDIIIDESVTIPIELMEKLIFENIGAQELLLLSRHDNLLGQNIAYRIFRCIRL